ncbi:OmpH family outer membrane protein [Novosphingobium sp. TH158]|uniref:OmpH family outer membrane protein n=1 Tax=Novosphingobium sp. TH158 TaxID=2067455 RepID=UPI000C7C60B1|nr:OmpH family outer membrane protein [Novosphingobium sp. TH158]PLK25686.1 hypothetical protein C0V78_01355 [Novosphingobium sp. TH158]
MKTTLKALALASPAALLLAAPAQAQVAGIATANPTVAVGRTKAFAAANQKIDTNYKSAFEQIDARRKSAQGIIQPLLAQLDTNKDKKVDDAELEAANKANNPVLKQIDDAEKAAQADISRLSSPVVRSQAYAIEQLLAQYKAAQDRVVAARRVSVILTPDSFIYAPPEADLTQAIAAELDTLVPNPSIDAPTTWAPQQQTLELQQQLGRLMQIDMSRAAQAAQAQGANAQAPAAQPAANAKPKKPSGR